MRRSLRLPLLLAALAVATFLSLRKHTTLFDASAFSGKETLEGGATVERVELDDPKASLYVVKVPRGSGLKLRAVLADPAKQRLAAVSEIAVAWRAIAAINGDYHRTDGFCFASTYSTLVDGGLARMVGHPLAGASFVVGADGAPRIGALDLSARLVASAASFDVNVDLEMGRHLLIDRPPSGLWSAKRKGVELAREGDAFRVRSEEKTSFQGPALLAPTGASITSITEGDALKLELGGADAGKTWLAIGTAPRLLDAGEISPAALASKEHPEFELRAQRTAVGLDEHHVYLVATTQEAHGGLSMADLARAMKKLGCRDALNLDGGPSTTLWAGRSLTVGPDASVASALLVLPANAPGPALR